MTATASVIATTTQGDGGGDGKGFGSGAISAGDALLVFVGSSTNADVIGVPGTGTWAEVDPAGDKIVTTSGGQYRAFECRNPVASTTYTFTLTGGRRSLAALRISGADITSSMVDVAGSLESAAAGTHAPPSLTPGAASELVVDALMFRQFNPDTSTCTPPVTGLSWTEIADFRGADGNNNVQIAINTATAGSSGVAISTAALNTVDTFEPAMVFRVVIKSAGGGGSPVTIQDTSSGQGTSGSEDGRALGDSSTGGGTAGTDDGRALGDGSSGQGTAGSADGRALGDGSSGQGTGGSEDGRALGDGSSAFGTAGAADAVVTGGVIVQDTSGGSGSGGGADGRALGSVPGGQGTGGSGDTVPGGPVTISDTSGGGGTGGSPDTVTSSQVVHDTMVMPILLQSRACLVTEVGKLAFPPLHIQIRPGATFQPQADQFIDECCDGIAWVRRGTMTPTGPDWPNQLAQSSKNPPSWYAIQIELGIERCVPVTADADGSNVTGDQWLQAAINQEDDGAALRRAICCLREIYGNDAVIENPIVPLENEGRCGGQVVTVTVRARACECVE